MKEVGLLRPILCFITYFCIFDIINASSYEISPPIKKPKHIIGLASIIDTTIPLQAMTTLKTLKIIAFILHFPYYLSIAISNLNLIPVRPICFIKFNKCRDINSG